MLKDAYDILKRMRGGLRHGGFTIVETMIVLAVTGALFISVAALINGRQNRTEFDQSIHQIQSQLQQRLNEVTTGYFPNGSSFTCNASSTGPSLSTVGSKEQGTNQDCLFVGKVIQLGVQGTDPEQLNVYTLAGLKQDISGNNVTTLAAAMPTPVYPFGSNEPDLTIRDKLSYGLTTKPGGMTYNDGTSHPVGAFALVASLDHSNGVGSQQVNLIPVNGTSLQQSESDAATAIQTGLRAGGGSVVNPSGGISICFVSGTTDQSGLITIGSNGRQLSVTLSVKGNTTCS